MNSKTLFSDLVVRIDLHESPDELNQLVLMMMEHALNISANQILTGIEVDFTPEKKSKVDSMIQRLNQHEPLHYIVGKADFFGRSFFVNPSVLIPRPETEELVNLVCGLNPAKILDIGTGSGCIAVTLQLELPKATVFATDVSEDALVVAKKNAVTLSAHVEFSNHNILQNEIRIRELDSVVSNPPYITEHEKKTMRSNVLHYEPHLALFVPNENPLIFYKAIAEKSRPALKPGGSVVVEINEHLGKGVAEVFDLSGYSDISVLKDINGKDRIVSARYLSP